MAKGKLKILLVDDNEDDLFLTNHFISTIDAFDITVDTEKNYRTAREKILKNEHDVYLVDYLLGPETGLDLIKECTRQGIIKPFILLTGKGGREVDREAASAGVFDYLTKGDLNTELLERSLRYSYQRYLSYNAIAESEKRYREIFSKSNDIIFVLDSNFCLLNFNPTMSNLMGYSLEDLEHQPIAGLFETEGKAKGFLSQIESGDLTSQMEIVLLTKAKIPKTFLASFSKINSIDGTLQYQCILHDYTSMKKSVAEQILNEKISATNKLVRSLAHEIRNPLTNINLSVHQLEAEVKEENRIFTDIIERNSKRINDLIEELVNIANTTERGRERLEIKQLLQSALSDAMDRIKLKSIELVENFEINGASMVGDRMKMQTAFLNIIINAVEAMENGKGRLKVEASQKDKDVLIKIEDNGSGIATENLPYLFQPYFTGKKNGMGLGLATTHSFIKAHNGEIEVDSTPGRGTTFLIKLKAS